MIVDDDTGVRDSLAAFLSRAGLETAQAMDGLHALDVLARSRPDLIVLDVLMPAWTGERPYAAYVVTTIGSR